MSANQTPTAPLTPGQLYARSIGKECVGKEQCHWCSGPAAAFKLTHDDLPPTIGIKNRHQAKRPGSQWACVGCDIWRRQRRITANWLGGGQLDGIYSGNHSWLIFDQKWGTLDPGPWAIHWESFKALYTFLLKPLKRWCLALRADCGGWRVGHSGRAFLTPEFLQTAPENYLHTAVVNDVPEVLAGTVFQFTLNNVVHSYSPYELEQGLRHGKEGKEPGVRILIELLGPCVLPPLPVDPEKPKVGHPYPDTAHRTLGKKLK